MGAVVVVRVQEADEIRPQGGEAGDEGADKGGAVALVQDGLVDPFHAAVALEAAGGAAGSTGRNRSRLARRRVKWPPTRTNAQRPFPHHLPGGPTWPLNGGAWGNLSPRSRPRSGP